MWNICSANLQLSLANRVKAIIMMHPHFVGFLHPWWGLASFCFPQVGFREVLRYLQIFTRKQRTFPEHIGQYSFPQPDFVFRNVSNLKFCKAAVCPKVSMRMWYTWLCLKYVQNAKVANFEKLTSNYRPEIFAGWVTSTMGHWTDDQVLSF